MFSEQGLQIRMLLRSGELVDIGGKPQGSPGRVSQAGTRTRHLVLAFAAIYLVWGSTYLAIRYAVETIPPLVTAAVRHSVAGSVLLLLALARGYRPKREHWIAGAIGGVFFFLIGPGTLHWAAQYVGSGL